MLIICRTCNHDVQARTGQTIVVRPGDAGAEIAPTTALKNYRAKLKRSKSWDNRTYKEDWSASYLQHLKKTPGSRSLLNDVFKMLRKGDVCLAFAENESWDTSARRAITGLFLGAGIKPEDISVGHDLTADEAQSMADMYRMYQAL